MIEPDSIYIPHDRFRFKHVGRFPDGRGYIALKTGGFLRGAPLKRENKKWMVVVHLFDNNGRHLTSDVRFVGFDTEDTENIRKRSTQMFDDMWDEYELTKADLQGVFIKPFSIEKEGILFGLVYSYYVEDETGLIHEQATFWPSDVVFYPPWDDGLYDT